MNEQQDFEFPQPSGGGTVIEGAVVATLRRIDPPKPSDKPNDRGQHPMQSIFHWEIDGYPDNDQWSYINVEAYGDKSNFAKVYKALTGKTLDRGRPPRTSEMVGRRCQLLCEESTVRPGYTSVRGYLPLPRAAAPVRRPEVVATPAPAEEAWDAEEVPFD